MHLCISCLANCYLCHHVTADNMNGDDSETTLRFLLHWYYSNFLTTYIQKNLLSRGSCLWWQLWGCVFSKFIFFHKPVIDIQVSAYTFHHVLFSALDSYIFGNILATSCCISGLVQTTRTSPWEGGGQGNSLFHQSNSMCYGFPDFHNVLMVRIYFGFILNLNNPSLTLWL